MRTAYIVTGLGYGDEGKGAMVDFLAREQGADTVVRFNGGAQAGHNVVLPHRPQAPGATITVHHEFRQWGSATFVPGVRTHLSRFHLVDPEYMFHEADEIGSRTGRNLWREGLLSIDRGANVVTPWHRSANRLRELARGGGRHGSTGFGIWEAESDKRKGLGLTIGEVADLSVKDLVTRLREIQYRKEDEVRDTVRTGVPGGWGNAVANEMRSALAPDVAETFKILAGLATLTDGLPKDAERMVFEGAQGVLLDEDFGWHPHTTGSKTTSANARILLADAGVPDERITHIGCVRAYGTRHGAGPFVGEDPGFDFDEPHNSAGAWQGQWRQGYLDLVALRYAVDCDPHVDGIALSHLDRLDGMAHWPVISEYENLPGDGRIPVPKNRDEQAHLGACMNSIETVVAYVEAADLVHEIRNACGRRVAYTASGPTHQDRVQHGRLNVATTGINSRVMAGPCPFPNLVKA